MNRAFFCSSCFLNSCRLGSGGAGLLDSDRDPALLKLACRGLRKPSDSNILGAFGLETFDFGLPGWLGGNAGERKGGKAQSKLDESSGDGGRAKTLRGFGFVALRVADGLRGLP